MNALKRLFFISLLLLGGLYYLGMTENGLYATLKLVNYCLQGKLQVQKAEGTLFHAFSLKKLSYQDDTQSLLLEHAHIEWQPRALLGDMLLINTLELRGLHYQSHSNAKTQGVNLPSLKIFSHLIINHATLEKVTIGSFQLDQLTLSKEKNTYSTDFTGLIAETPFNGSATIFFADDHLAIHHAYLNMAKANLALSGKVAESWDLSWHLNLPDLQAILKNAKGALLSRGHIEGNRLTPQIRGELKGKNLSYAHYQIPLIYNEFIINISEHSLNLKLMSLLSEKNQLISNLNLPAFNHTLDINQPFTADLQIKFNRLAAVLPTLPGIKEVNGNLDGELHLKGRMNAIKSSGRFVLSNGQFLIEALGTRVSHIQLTANAIQQQLNLTGQLSIQKEVAALNGSLILNPFLLRLSLKGHQLPIVNLPEYKISISPDIIFSFDDHIHLKGSISIPNAQILPKNLETVVSLPDEVVFAHKPVKKKAWPNNLDLQLKLILDQAVHLAYKGLDAHLAGSVTVQQVPKQLPSAQGKIDISNGAYEAYGKKLKLKDSYISYTGNAITNPNLNIRAVTKIKRTNITDTNQTIEATYVDESVIIVGVHVLGTADKPTVALFSIPNTLSKSDILSYLILGVPKSQASSQQLNMVMTALSALNSSEKTQLSGVTDKISKIFSLADFSFDSTNKSVGIGKRIFKGLYVQYSMGLFDSVSTLSLRYKINKRLSIQSETNQEEQGVDLLYGFERD